VTRWLSRQAMIDGSPHRDEALRRKLRDARERIANSAGYRRLRVADAPGYHYEKLTSA